MNKLSECSSVEELKEETVRVKDNNPELFNARQAVIDAENSIDKRSVDHEKENIVEAVGWTNDEWDVACGEGVLVHAKDRSHTETMLLLCEHLTKRELAMMLSQRTQSLVEARMKEEILSKFGIM